MSNNQKLKVKKDIDYNKIRERMENMVLEELENTKKSAKPLHELVITDNFIVNDVISKSESTSYTPGPIMVGGRNYSHDAGYMTYLTLSVTPDNPNLPIRHLDFHGSSIVKSGDYITAAIPILLEKDQRVDTYSTTKKFYLPRKPEQKESAIELIIKSESGKILRTDRSVDYSRYQPVNLGAHFNK